MIDCCFGGGLCVVCYQRNKQTKQQHSNNHNSISAVTHGAMCAKQGSKFLSLGKNYFCRKTQKSFFLPYSWYGKANFFLKTGRYWLDIGFKIGLNKKLSMCKETSENMF